MKKEILKLVDDYLKNFNEEDFEPLNGDETENIGQNIILMLDIFNGNITQEEYEKKKGKL